MNTLTITLSRQATPDQATADLCAYVQEHLMLWPLTSEEHEALSYRIRCWFKLAQIKGGQTILDEVQSPLSVLHAEAA